MTEHILFSLASIVIFGVGAQWLAWRLGLPSILLLLVAGFLAGPGTGLIKPDEILGPLLFPIVSLSVAVILFEGGLGLRLNELYQSGHLIRNLVSLGALVTWLICTVAAILIANLPLELAVLLGAILVVTGPTVIGPLLRVVRPSEHIGAILKWEGIVIDPLGASLAVLVFEVIIAEELLATSTVMVAVQVVVLTLIAGFVLGFLGAVVIVVLLRRYWVPDYLQNLVVLMMVVLIFVIADIFQEESGLLAVTIMGIVLANQRFVSIKHILEFKENLGLLLIGGLFLLLTARLQLDDLTALGGESLLFLAVVIFIARPLAVWLSTLRSELTWRERAFLSWVAPRGIVAAAVSSLFAIRMAEEGIEGAERLVPLTFLVIVGTVIVYSLTALPVARWLGIARPNPQGVLIVGARSLSCAIGHALQSRGYQVLLVDSNPAVCEQARMTGLPVKHGNILSDEMHRDISPGIGRLLALTANDEVNALASQEWLEVFGSAEVYQLTPHEAIDDGFAIHAQLLRGRPLFGHEVNYTFLVERLNAGAVIETITLPTNLDRTALRSTLSRVVIPFFLINQDGTLTVATAERPINLRPGQVIIGLVDDVTRSLDIAELRTSPQQIDSNAI